MTSDDGGFSRTEIPELEGWLTFPQAGRVLKVSKQMIHKMVFALRLFDTSKDVRRVGDKPIYLVREQTILAHKKSKEMLH